MSETFDRGPSALNVPPLDSTLEQQLPLRVRDAVRRMKQIVPVLSVSVLALRRQNAELDEDVASVLDRHASEPLDVLVDELEFLMEEIVAPRAERGRAGT